MLHKLIHSTDRNLNGRYSPVTQDLYVDFWKNFDPAATVSIQPTIEEALNQVRDLGRQSNSMQALVTGSLHLVSGALYLLEEILAGEEEAPE